jgi:hypothetical protein
VRATSNPAQSEFSESPLPISKSLVERLAIEPADLETDQSERTRLDERVALALVAITFCIGAVATLAWQSYGDAVRRTIAPQIAPATQNNPPVIALPASAPPFPSQQQLKAMSLDLDEVRQSIAHIATNIAASQEQMTRSVDRIVASQEQMVRAVDQLAAGQEQLTRTIDRLAVDHEQLTREITKLQASEQQYILYRSAKPLAPRPVPQPSQGQPAR